MGECRQAAACTRRATLLRTRALASQHATACHACFLLRTVFRPLSPYASAPGSLLLQVDNWQQVDPQWLVNWITSHANDAATVLKKPLVLEEVGRRVEGREAGREVGRPCKGSAGHFRA